MNRPLKVVIPANAGIRNKAAGFRVKPGMTGFIAGGSTSRHKP
jgi:hypothetical protein